MRKLRTLTIILLALVWVPLTSHCKLEGLTGLEFFRCATEASHAPESGDPCEGNECCAIESAKYQAFRQQVILPALFQAVLPAEDLSALTVVPPAQIYLSLLAAAPPERSSSWQFSYRTALPVRAPSDAS